MKTLLMYISATLVLFLGNHAMAQLPTPTPEHEMLKKEAGTWDVEIKAMGQSTKGTESSRMLGGFWLITDFKGKLMGMDLSLIHI